MKVLPYTLIFCLCAGLLSCENSREVEGNETTATNAEDTETIKVVKTGETAEEELEDFRTWLNKQTEKGDDAIRKEWPSVKEELRARNAELEKDFENMSEESKKEYRALQERYSRWEERQERRQSQPLDAAKVKEWQSQLLEEHQNVGAIEAGNLREAYLVFMGDVRAKRRSWTQDDWDYVDHVYGNLNQRRSEVEEQLSTADNLKIRALQTEYLALEGSADTQNMVQKVE
ncbi:hypothetical protein [Pontibacter akesuensis]|uniref:Uncharacterized protein n=1 Tax=Pontibacter akesuensis TaxID=388950 RepID=A0A1I7KHM2_9BACT|nr:hypothetical protein [Pontibacter akesuensis]GHA78968.1 hypothetical protein GCM10007389_36330 [Pontibacter akesuensis]SFU96921.1 hypothetical protein SAMN04487941_3755 [Pontibacter akesuensis]